MRVKLSQGDPKQDRVTPQSTFTLADLLRARMVLAIQPHYDDNDLGAGGTLAALSRAGAHIVYLTVTDDQVGVTDPSLSPGDTERSLRGEQAEAGRLIGVEKQLWLGYPDAGPINYYSLRENIVVAIRELQPDVVFTVDPWLPYEFHQDHVLTGRAVSEAVGLFGFPRLKVRGQIAAAYEAHALLGIAYYFTHAPNTYFDISNMRTLKEQAIRCYKMQFGPDAMERMVIQLEQQAREAARQGASEFAEPLKLLHPSQLHIQTDTWKR
jgi:LmbE family N-acetylglucosaminyl deacetylase